MNNFKQFIVNLFPFSAKYIHINRGLDYIKEEADAEEKDYVMGADNDINWKVLQEDGNWLNSLPENEVQRGNNLETMGCTGYALLNILEILAKQKWGETWNLSDRYLNCMSNTGVNGNSMKTVLETVRKYGCVNESTFGWDRNTFNWSQYYTKPNQSIIDQGIAWTKKYSFGYEKVWNSDNSLREAIKYSPLYIAVYAWYSRGALYYSVGNANHASVLAQMPPKVDYDSYDPFIKHLDENFSIPYVYRIYLEKKELSYNQEALKKLMDRGLKYIMRPLSNGEIYELREDGLRKLSADEARDFGIRTLEKSKELIGVTESLYNSLLV